MKKEETGKREDKNILTMFPSSKNFSPQITDDPLEELLTEFDDIDLDEQLSEQEEGIIESDQDMMVFMPFDKYHSLGDKMSLLKKKITKLKDTQNKSHYYLKEISSYLPQSTKE